MHDGKAIGGRRLAISAGAAALLAPLNSTMIAVALPAIRDEFDVGIVAVSWLVTSYLVAVTISQPIGGRLGDAIGSLAVLRMGLAGMAITSVAAAASPSFELLVATRSLQGVAAALLIPGATAYLRKAVDVASLPAVLGTNGAMISAGAALGPVAGGIILAAGGWQWLFLLNIPAVAAVWLLLWPLPADGGRGLATFRIDPASLAALVGAFSGLALLGSALRSGDAAFPVAALALAVVGLAAYGWRYRASRQGVVDLDLFRAPAFARSSVMTALSNLVMYTTLVALPVYLRDERGVGTGAIGALLFSMSATSVLAGPIGGRVAMRFGVRAGLLSGSSVLVMATAGVLGAVAAGAAYPLAGPLALVGIGMGLAGPAQQSSGLAAWPASMAGSAAGTLSFMRYVGSVAGASLLAAVLGRDPGPGAFEALAAILVLAAVLNAVLALRSSGQRARAAEQLARTPA